MDILKIVHVCMYVNLHHPLVEMNVIQYADMHHPCVVRILWSMLTYITHGYLENDSCMYVNLHHPLDILKIVHVRMYVNLHHW